MSDGGATSDKWERRRAARRAANRVRAVSGLPGLHPPETIWRPRCLDRAFVLWMVIGVPLVLAMIGIVIVLAAFSMRAGYRGGRIWLTVLALPSFSAPPIWVWVAWMAAANGDPARALMALPLVVPAAVVITATVLMWPPEANQFYHATSRPSAS